MGGQQPQLARRNLRKAQRAGRRAPEVVAAVRHLTNSNDCTLSCLHILDAGRALLNRWVIRETQCCCPAGCCHILVLPLLMFHYAITTVAQLRRSSKESTYQVLHDGGEGEDVAAGRDLRSYWRPQCDRACQRLPASLHVHLWNMPQISVTGG